MPLKIGITGGIGSGKTTVARIFGVLGIPVYYADDAARRIMNEDETLKEQIIKEFGPESYINGQLNRVYLSSIVFKDKKISGTECVGAPGNDSKFKCMDEMPDSSLCYS